MSGNKALLDTNCIIFASKQKLDYEKLLLRYDSFYVSIITYMEVYSYDFINTEEKQLVDELFKALEIIDINKSVAEQAINYRKNKTKKIKLPDAIILATAKYIGAALITDDWDDFQEIDSDLLVIKIDDLKKA